ncbi:hypothetical protein [Lentilactobacillus kisonensis]|uniref:Lmo0937 family membrane protein n=1 Tax=Lentilactobacillus kisonensis F0435 TaxID=797516 RepID=H1LK71_9LACO|nr:hypothetical protein [Lentilactobacillus kisonensis]EHO48011.1 hypothetical protein HMPREF9104_03017 [Lentilactobacillus kisonensis F0435]
MAKTRLILLVVIWLLTMALFIAFIFGSGNFSSVLVLFVISLVLTVAFRNG